MTPFHSTSKADFGELKIPYVLKIFAKPRRVKNSPATGVAFAGKHVVKSVKETCETVHSIPKENCQHVTQFDRPCKTAFLGFQRDTKRCGKV